MLSSSRDQTLSILLKKRWNEGTLPRFCRWSKQTQQTPWRRSFTAEDAKAPSSRKTSEHHQRHDREIADKAKASKMFNIGHETENILMHTATYWYSTVIKRTVCPKRFRKEVHLIKDNNVCLLQIQHLPTSPKSPKILHVFSRIRSPKIFNQFQSSPRIS